jgi:tmRNA-binding protein
VVSRIFIITTVKFKELKINTEVEEIHPTAGIKNAGMEKKSLEDLHSNIQKSYTIITNLSYNRRMFIDNRGQSKRKDKKAII